MGKTTSNSKKATTKGAGKTAAEINDPEIIHRVYEDHRAGMSFSECEKKYGLRQSNGSTALRVCYKYVAMADETKKEKRRVKK